MRIQFWLQAHTHSLSGKTVALTGSTGGLGSALCRHLAALGADLILLNRNPSKAAAQERTLKEEFPRLSIRHLVVDMEDMASVKQAVARLQTLPLDALILNAGAYDIPRHTCENGFDNVFTINFVSPYFMARELYETIRARGGKIVAVGSIAHRYSKTDRRDVDFAGRKQPSLVYGNAKRRLMVALWQLGDGVTVAHPGITFTGITDHYPPLIFALIKHPMKILFPKTRQASLPILWGLFTDTAPGQWLGPALLDIWGAPKKKTLRSISVAEQADIAAESEQCIRSMSGT